MKRILPTLCNLSAVGLLFIISQSLQASQYACSQEAKQRDEQDAQQERTFWTKQNLSVFVPETKIERDYKLTRNLCRQDDQVRLVFWLENNFANEVVKLTYHFGVYAENGNKLLVGCKNKELIHDGELPNRSRNWRTVPMKKMLEVALEKFFGIKICHFKEVDGDCLNQPNKAVTFNASGDSEGIHFDDIHEQKSEKTCFEYQIVELSEN